MRNILFILLFIPTVLCGQRIKVSNLPAATTVDEDDVTIIVQDGTTKKVTKDDLQEEIRDSVTNHETRITTNAEALIGLTQDWFEITDSGDSIKFWEGPNWVKIATGTAGVNDITAPTGTAEVGLVTDDSIRITFSETVVKDSIPAVNDFVVTINGVSVSVLGLHLKASGAHITLGLVIDVTEGDLVAITYTKPTSGRIQDTSNNPMQTVTLSVSNNVACDAVSAYAHWLFENNGNDEIGANNLTSFAAYAGTPDNIHGTYSGNLNVANYYFSVPSIAYGNTFTIVITFDEWNGSNTRTLYSTMADDATGDGFMIRYDYTSDRIEVMTGNGAAGLEAYSTSSLGMDNTAHQVAVTFNKTGSVCVMYFDGSDVTSVGTTRGDYATTGAARIGLSFDDTKELFGYADDVQVYQVILTASQVATNYGSLGSVIAISDCGDPEVPNDSITYIGKYFFDNVTIGGDLTEQDLEDGISTFYNLEAEGENPPIADNAEYIVRNSDTVLRSRYPIGACCTETNSSFETNQGGTGIYFKNWIYANGADQSHGYLYFEVELASNFDTPGIYGGGKFPRVRSREPSGHSIVGDQSGYGGSFGLMWKQMDGEDLQLRWYNYDHTGYDYDWARGGAIVGEISRGSVHEIVYRWFSGDVSTYNGFVELFIDNTLVDSWTVLNFTEDASINFDQWEVASFAGGDSDKYTMPVETWMDFRNFVLFYFNPGTEGVPPYNFPSPTGRVLDLPF